MIELSHASLINDTSEWDYIDPITILYQRERSNCLQALLAEGINGCYIHIEDLHSTNPYNTTLRLIVYDLKFVGPLEFELVASMPEQLKITTIHFFEALWKPYQKLPAEKLGEIFSLFFV